MDSAASLEWLGQQLNMATSSIPVLLDPSSSPGPGLREPPTLTMYITICLGTFLGNIAMGICGFGTAIILLSCWALAGAFGFDAGPLKLAVISCSCALTVAVIPFFFLTNATENAVRPLAMSKPLTKAIAAPCGALVLKILPARQLELVMSLLMVAMMLLINKQSLKEGAIKLHSMLFGKPEPEDILPHSRVPPIKIRASEVGDMERSEYSMVPSNNDTDGQSDYVDREGSSSTDSNSLPDYLADTPAHGILVHTEGYGAEFLAEPPLDAAVVIRCAGGLWEDEQQQRQRPEQQEPLLVHSTAAGGTNHDAVGAQIVAKYGFWRLIVIGACIGLCTGILGGMTGISGPPMMIMYAYLDIPKASLRGTNAVMSMVQDQLIGYWLLGMIRSQELKLYICASSAGGVGLLIGNSLSKIMDQRQFKAVMTVLMLTCVLMGCAAIGLFTIAG